jgi:hypothetical protein
LTVHENAAGKVDHTTVFRSNAKGALTGPYLSQFIITDVPYGVQMISARVAFGLPSFKDYMTTEADYLAAQNGQKPIIQVQPIAEPTIIHDGRGLGNYVHIDELFQGYLNACLLLITPTKRKGFGAPWAAGNPYSNSKTQARFGTLGEPNYKTLVPRSRLADSKRCRGRSGMCIVASGLRYSAHDCTGTLIRAASMTLTRPNLRS